MKKILKIDSPIISSYHSTADLDSIIKNHRFHTEWVMNNYIQLEAIPPVNWPADDSIRIDFLGSSVIWECCPLICYQRLKRDFVHDNWASIIEFIIKSINLGSYLYIDVDRFFLPSYPSYQHHPDIHDVFVYGYDTENRIIYYSDFFDNNKYGQSTATFEEFENAYLEMYNAENKCYQDKDCIELISIREPQDGETYSFDINTVRKSISEYVYASNPSCNLLPYRKDLPVTQNNFYGMKVYENFIYFLTVVLEVDKFTMDLRTISVLCDHKKLMLMRIKYMGDEGYLNHPDECYERFKTIHKNMLIIRSKLLKYFLIIDKQLISEIMEILHGIILEEKEVLLFVLENMNESGIYNNRSKQEHSSLDLIPMRGLWRYKGNGKIHGYSHEDNAFALTNIHCSNFKFEADILLENCTAASLLFRGNKYLNEFYCANIDIGGKVKLWRPKKELAVVNYNIEYHKKYRICVEARQDNIKVFLDGRKLIDIVDSKIEEGYLGFNVFENSAQFENIHYEML